MQGDEASACARSRGRASSRPSDLCARGALVAIAVALVAPLDASAGAGAPAARSRAAAPRAKGADRVAFGHSGALRHAREVVGRRDEPVSLEEDTAMQIEKLLRGPLRRGITGLYVADARTGEPLFAVNADDPLNPASNVKMISTATALALLGPEFRYTTRVFGREPDRRGTVKGDLYLLGTWDPTLTTSDLDQLARQVAARGVKHVEGDVVVGKDPTRDGIYHSVIPVEIVAGEPGEPPTAFTPPNFDLLEVDMKATTDRKPLRRHRLSFHAETIKNAAGRLRIRLTVTGSIGADGETTYRLYTRERAAMASHALIAALRANGVVVTGDMGSKELTDFIGGQVGATGLPVELARHQSDPLQEIVRRVNKWSVNWLADRIVMTAAALARRTEPSMQVAIDAMYAWLQRHPKLDRDNLVIDTGSGLSYRTRITPQAIVKIVRAAAGFAPGIDPALTRAWQDSLAIAGTDGTLRSRFITAGTINELRGRLRGKTGSLSTVIALSGLIEVDPRRPLAFSLVTNTDRPLKKPFVRRAHEQLLALLGSYAKASAPPAAPTATASAPSARPLPAVTPLPNQDEKALGISDDVAEPQLDPVLDDDTAGKDTSAGAEAPVSPAAE